MYAPWNTEPKINVAKKVMGRLMDSIQNIPDLEIALRCYGHTTFFRPVRNCKDSKLEIPFDKALVNAPKIKEFINKDSLEETPKDKEFFSFESIIKKYI
jgi:Ca-activated chloride channel family protein